MPPKRKLKSATNQSAKVKKDDEDDYTQVDDLYNMKIPLHVYRFYNFCKTICESNPLSEFQNAYFYS